MKINLQPPAKKRRRTLEETKDPIQIMLEKLSDIVEEESPPGKIEEPTPVSKIATELE